MELSNYRSGDLPNKLACLNSLWCELVMGYVSICKIPPYVIAVHFKVAVQMRNYRLAFREELGATFIERVRQGMNVSPEVQMYFLNHLYIPILQQLLSVGIDQIPRNFRIERIEFPLPFSLS